MAGLIVPFVFVSGVLGLVWAYMNYSKLKNVKVEEDGEALMGHNSPVKIGKIIQSGAYQFIIAEYQICFLFIVIMAAIVYVCVDSGEDFYTTIAFSVGALTSMFCGAFGMAVATSSNYRTTLEAKHSLGRAFNTAYRAGCVIGFTIVSISMMVLMVIILVYKDFMKVEDQAPADKANYFEEMFEAIAGYGLGGSTVALFARVGGGIYTKAADLGSDLVGKVEADLPEDSPRNPATIADNVGDNVGDVAGMSADLFGSFAESTCAALVIASNSIQSLDGSLHIDKLIFVLAIPAIGILACIVVTYYVNEHVNVQQDVEVEGELKRQLIFSTVLLLPLLYFLCTFIFPTGFQFIANDGNKY